MLSDLMMLGIPKKLVQHISGLDPRHL